MKIIGTGSALPSLSVTNDMLSVFLNTDDEWISTRTGIKERRILSHDSLKEIAAQAANNALEDAKIEAKDLDFILCSNVINNFVTPALSCIIQGEIKADCPCLDINAACSGFVYGLDIAHSYIEIGKAKNILVIAAEEPTRLVNWNERNNCILFGDGAAAAVVSEGNGFMASHLTTMCNIEPLYYQRKMEYNPFVQHSDEDAPLIMHGKEVFKLAVSASIKDIDAVLRKSGLKADDIDFFILHQANLRIIQSIREYLNQPKSKFPHNIEKYGNTSSASIPILLDELYKNNQIKKGNKIVLSAFGAGFVTGAMVFEWTK